MFSVRFEARARALAEETNSPRLTRVTVSRRTFDRWYSGTWRGRPQLDAMLLLEALLGFACAELFGPAPGVLGTRREVPDQGGLQALLGRGLISDGPLDRTRRACSSSPIWAPVPTGAPSRPPSPPATDHAIAGVPHAPHGVHQGPGVLLGHGPR